MSAQRKIAVVLSGCGVYDGAEIHESVLSLLALDKRGVAVSVFAPDIPQHHVINHLTGSEQAESRNVLVESARIARGAIAPLTSYDAAEFDAIFLPGGFGAAKNLSSFAFAGAAGTVDPSVAAALQATHAAGKPIGALCIAPAVVAKALGLGTLTIGDDAGTAAEVEKCGATHQNAAAEAIVIDAANKIVTCPCYMLATRISQIAEGAEAAVEALLGLI